ncbi:hypothetical protein H0H92_009106 [Tricholoma furcatifolium]|nr:hypothetical protein H0H92_009106 [Tricholoma furcatifolium]
MQVAFGYRLGRGEYLANSYHGVDLRNPQFLFYYIEEAVWERVKYYAGLIQMLYYKDPVPVLLLKTVDEIRRKLMYQPLLPRLHTLVYPAATPEMPLITSPSLRHVVELRMPNSSPSNPQLICLLLDKAPLLENFVLEQLDILPQTLAALAKFGHLKVARLGDIPNISSLQNVFDHTHLVEFECFVPFDRKSIEPGFQLNTPCLRSLSLEGHPVSLQIALNCFRRAPLTTLRLCSENLSDTEHDEEFVDPQLFDLRIFAIWSDTLEVFDMKDKFDIILDAETILSHSSPLLRMTGLKHVRFGSYKQVRFRDSDYDRIARAWPNLKSLDVFDSTSPGLNIWEDPEYPIPPPFATFASLQSFAIHCPSLQKLSLPVHLQGSELMVKPKYFPSHALRKLYIRYPIDGDAKPIARHLLALFPCLDEVDGDKDEDEGPWGLSTDSDWGTDSVRKFVEFGRTVRADGGIR